eukprot:g42230.t1
MLWARSPRAAPGLTAHGVLGLTGHEAVLPVLVPPWDLAHAHSADSACSHRNSTLRGIGEEKGKTTKRRELKNREKVKRLESRGALTRTSFFAAILTRSQDNIPAIVLKTCAPELAAHLAKLFQYSYNTGTYPTMWKIAQECPVYKKQDKSNPANYHPISLLLSITKVMEGVINSAIKQHLLSNKLLSDAQFGFQQVHPAPDLITVLVQTWTKELNSRV